MYLSIRIVLPCSVRNPRLSENEGNYDPPPPKALFEILRADEIFHSWKDIVGAQKNTIKNIIIISNVENIC